MVTGADADLEPEEPLPKLLTTTGATGALPPNRTFIGASWPDGRTTAVPVAAGTGVEVGSGTCGSCTVLWVAEPLGPPLAKRFHKARVKVIASEAITTWASSQRFLGLFIISSTDNQSSPPPESSPWLLDEEVLGGDDPPDDPPAAVSCSWIWAREVTNRICPWGLTYTMLPELKVTL